MTFFIALTLLLVVALIMMFPEHPLIKSIFHLTENHKVFSAALFGGLFLLLLVAASRPGPGSYEEDERGYAELWYMVQSNPVVRPLARRHFEDGTISRDEMQEIRELYRGVTDKDTMRMGVAQELLDKKEF